MSEIIETIIAVVLGIPLSFTGFILIVCISNFIIDICNSPGGIDMWESEICSINSEKELDFFIFNKIGGALDV